MLFPATSITKLDLVHYYLSVADGALGGAGGRPNMAVRRANGIAEECFFQKRAPAARPTWIGPPYKKQRGEPPRAQPTRRRLAAVVEPPAKENDGSAPPKAAGRRRPARVRKES